jgi:superfamily II DNA or RNA helicase
MELRPYQVQAVSNLRVAFRQGNHAALLVMPTGAGKTVVFTEIARSATQRGNSVFILVHRRELVKQASDKLTKAGVQHGIIAAGFKTSKHKVQVASVQTLAKRLLTVPAEPDLIIIDEAHHAVAGSWDKILAKFKTARVVGVTATPSRLDGRGLGSHFSTLVSGPSVEQLTKLGFLSPHRVFAPPVIADLSNVKTRAGDYANDQLSAAMDRPTITGDAIGHYKRLADGLPAIAFCCSVAHATSVCASFNAAGYRAKLVTGNMPMEERDEAISGLADGRTQVLCSVDVVSEGTDVPAVSAAILLRPTQSEALYLQQVGRILRPQPGKIAIVLDHVGSTLKHGFIDDVRPWSLDSKPRRKKNDEPAPSVRQCPMCFAAFKPQPVCPMCGHEFPVKPKRQLTQREGELREMRRQDALERIEKKEQRKEIGRARTLPELLALAKKKGYKPGWAYKIFYGRRY